MSQSIRASHPSPLTLARDLVRWDEWYSSKVPLFFVCMYYAALSLPSTDVRLIGEMAVVLALLCAYASFGHLANDLSDRTIDRAASKPRPSILAEMSSASAQVIVWTVAIAGLAPATFYYWAKPDVICLVWLAYLVAALYSFPPIRLKERGVSGLFAAAAAQRTIPALIVFAALDTWDAASAALVALSTFLGLRFILVHQLHDLRNDLRTGTHTFGVHGAPLLRKLITHVVFPLELTSLAVALFTMSAKLPAIGAMSAVYLIWAAVALSMRRKQGKANSPVGYRLLTDLYFVYWPLVLAGILSFRSVEFVTVLLFTAVWQHRRIGREIRDAAAGPKIKYP